MLQELLNTLGLHDLALFSFTVLVLNATPGVDMVFAVSRTLAGGARAGVAASLGISAGCAVHSLLAAFGLAAVLAVSPWAFAAIKWAGAAYLVWLAWGMLSSVWAPAAAASDTSVVPECVPLWRLFRQGLLTNVLNPKVALFVLAFLPQFINPDAEHKTLAFLFLGAWLVVQGTLFLLVLVAVSARLRSLGGSPRLGRWLNGLGGGLFMGLAAKLALSEVR
ncbi:MAG: LysE family translocator [Vitreoscilla sp.]|nr:LysE family translocator [Burkholderiales bacterium]MBP6339476.1 LysE family translocator [Vitreoscilla sp.]MBP6676841.1 LysE family translocator [Vitreoscilla sp.]